MKNKIDGYKVKSDVSKCNGKTYYYVDKLDWIGFSPIAVFDEELDAVKFCALKNRELSGVVV